MNHTKRNSYFYSVGDYARDRGLSRQCIHARLNALELSEHTTIVNGKKFMDYEAFLQLESIFQNNKIVSLTKENQALKEENTLLLKQTTKFLDELSEIKKELAVLTKHIKEREGDSNEH